MSNTIGLPGLWANTSTPIAVEEELDLGKFGAIVRTFPAGIPCYGRDSEILYSWDPTDTTSALNAGVTIPVIVGGVQLGTWHSIGGKNVNVLALNTVVGAGLSLKNTIPSSAVTASVKGYYTSSDHGSAGLYVWNSVYAGAANDGTIVRPTLALVGAWFAVYSGPVHSKWFGAKGDDVADDSIPLQAFLDIGWGYIDPGTYLVTVPLVLPLGIFLEGPEKGESASILHWTGTGFCLNYTTTTNVEQNANIKGLAILCDGITTKGGILLNNANDYTVAHVKITGINSGGQACGIRVSNSDATNSANVYIQNSRIADMVGDGIQCYNDIASPGAACGGLFIFQNLINGCRWGINGDAGTTANGDPGQGTKNQVYIEQNIVQGCAAGHVTGSFLNGRIVTNHFEQGGAPLTSGAHIAVNLALQGFRGLTIENNFFSGVPGGADYDIDLVSLTPSHGLVIQGNDFARAQIGAIRCAGNIQNPDIGANSFLSVGEQLIIEQPPGTPIFNGSGLNYMCDAGRIVTVPAAKVVNAGAYSPRYDEELIQCVGACTITLPKGAIFGGSSGGRKYTICQLTNDTSTVLVSGTDTIAGKTSFKVRGLGAQTSFVSTTLNGGVNYTYIPIGTSDAFDPTFIAGCKCWLSARPELGGIDVNATKVLTRWSDLTNNGNDAVLTVPPTVRYNVSDYPFVKFDGATQYINLDGLAGLIVNGGTPYSYGLLLKWDTVTDSAICSFGRSIAAVTQDTLQSNTGAWETRKVSNGGLTASAAATNLNTNTNIVAVFRSYDGVNDSLWVNGVARAGDPAALNPGACSFEVFTLGAGGPFLVGVPTTFANLSLAEFVFVANTNISDADRRNLMFQWASPEQYGATFAPT